MLTPTEGQIGRYGNGRPLWRTVRAGRRIILAPNGFMYQVSLETPPFLAWTNFHTMQSARIARPTLTPLAPDTRLPAHHRGVNTG